MYDLVNIKFVHYYHGSFHFKSALKLQCTDPDFDPDHAVGPGFVEGSLRRSSPAR